MSTMHPQNDHAQPVSSDQKSWLILIFLWMVSAFLLLAPGDLVITTHWADALHLIDILDRMSQGQQPHRDFVTPLGNLAFSPISTLVAAGLPTGFSYLVTQIVLAGGLAAAALAIASKRMSWVWALLFAWAIMATTLALVHGLPEFSLTISIHYNRWCWALSFVALLAALLPPSRTARWEGVFVGVAMAALALIKITYFVAFFPLIALGFLATNQMRSLIATCITGAALALILTVLWGFDYWQAYMQDVLYVAGSDTRPYAGAGVLALLTSSEMLAPVALVGCAVYLLLKAGLQRQGLLLLWAFFAGSFVSDQNAGFDPLFLGLLALLLLVWKQELDESRRIFMSMIGLGLIVTITPNLLNLATSPLRAALVDRSSVVPLVIGGSRHQDILIGRGNANAGGQYHLVTDEQRYFFDHEPPSPMEFQNEVLPECQSLNSPSYFASIAADLADRDLAQGQTIFVADYLSPLWLFGDHPPLLGAAPWSYGSLPGIENADFVLFPTCPTRPAVHRLMLNELEEVPMTELVRTPLYRLYAVNLNP